MAHSAAWRGEARRGEARRRRRRWRRRRCRASRASRLATPPPPSARPSATRPSCNEPLRQFLQNFAQVLKVALKSAASRSFWQSSAQNFEGIAAAHADECHRCTSNLFTQQLARLTGRVPSLNATCSASEARMNAGKQLVGCCWTKALSTLLACTAEPSESASGWDPEPTLSQLPMAP